MPVLVPSLTHADRSYFVDDRGTTSICSCYQFDKKKACKHLRLVAQADDLIQRCMRYHGSEDGGLCRQCLVVFMAASARKVRRDYITKREHREQMQRKVASRKKRKEKARAHHD